MKLTYIYHSGFVLEENDFLIIIDYFIDSENHYIQQALNSFQGKIYVLASHQHLDHFNPAIMEWKKQRPDLQYILSKDILRKKLVEPHDAIFLMKGESWEDQNLQVQAFGSTDIGISFLIHASGKRIFHAGDLNNWHWKDESTPQEVKTAERHFFKELKNLSSTTNKLDLAMFPVDPRIGSDYMLGAKQFVDQFQIQIFAPMHFDDNYAQADAFQTYAEKAGCRFVCWSHTGETVELD